MNSTVEYKIDHVLYPCVADSSIFIITQGRPENNLQAATKSGEAFYGRHLAILTLAVMKFSRKFKKHGIRSKESKIADSTIGSAIFESLPHVYFIE